MLNLQNFRLSSLRHLNAFTRAPIRVTRINPSASGAQVVKRSVNTKNTTRPTFGFYTRKNVNRHSTWTTGKHSSTSSNLRRWYASFNGHGQGGSRGTTPLSTDNAFWILFSINAASFVTWGYASLTNNRSLMHLHLQNTLVSLASWDSGRWWTVITSAFAHHDLMHFAFNMLTLRTFCSIIGYVPGVGGAHILMLALGSAICASAGWIIQQKSKLAELRATATKTSSKWGLGSSGGNNNKAIHAAASQIYNANALGASGVVMGVSAVATCLLPSAPISLMFIPIGIPLWIITIGYAVADTYFLDSTTSRIAHSGHLGGLVFGAVYYLAFLRHAPLGVWRDLARRFGR